MLLISMFCTPYILLRPNIAFMTLKLLTKYSDILCSITVSCNSTIGSKTFLWEKLFLVDVKFFTIGVRRKVVTGSLMRLY